MVVINLDDTNISIFSCSNDDIEIPSDSNNDSLLTEKELKDKLNESKLKSDNISRAIQGETVKSVIFPEESGIITPNYVIDFRGLDEIYEFQMSALDALLHEDGNVALYACTNAGLAKLGFGLDLVLDRIIAVAVDKLFDKKCRIYRNFEPGTPPVVISHKDVTKMRLSI